MLLVDLSVPEPAADLEVLRRELAAYDAELGARPAIIAGTKADLVEDPAAAAAGLGPEALVVSSVTGDGVEALRERLGRLAEAAAAAAPERAPYVVLRPGRSRFIVTRDDAGHWQVRGRNVDRWVMETDLEDEGEVARLQARLRKEGVDRKLTSLGAKEGDEVEIQGRVFSFVPDTRPEPPEAEDG